MIKTALCKNKVSTIRLITDEEVRDAKILKMRGDQIFRIFDLYLTYKTETIKYHKEKYTLEELGILLDAKLYINDYTRTVHYKPQIIIRYVNGFSHGSQTIKEYNSDEEAEKAFEKYIKLFNLDIIS